jgi:hypothetical protein
VAGGADDERAAGRSRKRKKGISYPSEKFAPHILPATSFHTSPTFMPDGQEAYWKMQGTSTISMMKIADGLWTAPVEISLSSALKDFRDPYFSRRNPKESGQPTQAFISFRTKSGP